VTQKEEGTEARAREPSSECRVFVSYRRADSADATDRLAEALGRHFGSDRIFLDIDNIDLGADFPHAIESWVGSCDALVVVIGPQWVAATDRAGRRRLDDPHDYVRLEVEAGLRRRDVRVIPVMIHGAEMPLAEELPESLQPLRRRNALQIDRKNWRHDVERLCRALERLEQHHGDAPSPAAIRCLKCATVNSAGTSYCRTCGFSLFDDPVDVADPVDLEAPVDLDDSVEPSGLMEPPDARPTEENPEPPVFTRRGGPSPPTIDTATAPVSPDPISPVDEPRGLTRIEAAEAIVAGGSGLMIVSLLLPGVDHHVPWTRVPGYAVSVTCLCVALLVLVGTGRRSRRSGALLAGVLVAFALLGEALPLSWSHAAPGGHVSDAGYHAGAGFLLGVVGAMVAAAGGALAWWLADCATPRTGVTAARPTPRRVSRTLLLVTGPAIVIASLFLPQFESGTSKTVFDRWSQDPRYPLAIILLCCVIVALAVPGVGSSRRRLVVTAAAVACLLLGETLPLLHYGSFGHYGTGFWLGVVGAVISVIALSQAAAANGRGRPPVGQSLPGGLGPGRIT
jgi:hypothetical protein